MHRNDGKMSSATQVPYPARVEFCLSRQQGCLIRLTSVIEKSKLNNLPAASQPQLGAAVRYSAAAVDAYGGATTRIRLSPQADRTTASTASASSASVIYLNCMPEQRGLLLNAEPAAATAKCYAPLGRRVRLTSRARA